MTQMSATRLPDLIRTHESQILAEWMSHQLQSTATRRDLMNDEDLRKQSKDFLTSFTRAAESGSIDDLRGGNWVQVRELLTRVSQSRARQGFTPSETATFVFSLKQPLFSLIRQEI